MTELKRTDLSVQHERAILVKLITPGMSYDARSPLRELDSLAEAAGATVVDCVIQKRGKVSSRLYLGKGKAEELRERSDASDANIIIFDNDLTPAQIRELEKVTDRKIIDRSELILDIFAARAQTREARLQVELAQLQYTAPRLRGMWTHLERIAGAGGGSGVGMVGGIGTRGPGEQQIEIDRRIVADRVAHLKREIDKIDRRKQREVRSRSDQLTISLIGYTNSGKSTLMNALTDAGQTVEDKLFATLDTRTARWNLGGGKTALLSDTVGFVRDLPHRLVASFRATLEEAIHAQLLFHVVDVSAPDVLLQVEAVQTVEAELGLRDAPTVALLNKVDVAEDEAAIQILENRLPRSLRISARTGHGLDQLVQIVLDEIGEQVLDVTIRIGVGAGRLMAEIDRRADVLNRRFENNTALLDLRIDRTQLDHLRGRFPELQIVSPTSLADDRN